MLSRCDVLRAPRLRPTGEAQGGGAAQQRGQFCSHLVAEAPSDESNLNFTSIRSCTKSLVKVRLASGNVSGPLERKAVGFAVRNVIQGSKHMNCPVTTTCLEGMSRRLLGKRVRLHGRGDLPIDSKRVEEDNIMHLIDRGLFFLS